MERSTAAWAALALGFDHYLLMRQMIEAELAARAALVRTHELHLRVSFLVLGLILGELRLQILERECQLVVVDALGFAAEVRAADLCKKPLELGIAGRKLVALGEDGGQRAALGSDQRMQRLDIGRQSY